MMIQTNEETAPMNFPVDHAVRICEQAVEQHPGILMQFLNSTARGEHLCFTRSPARPADSFHQLRLQLRRELRAQRFAVVVETEDQQKFTVLIKSADPIPPPISKDQWSCLEFKTIGAR